MKQVVEKEWVKYSYHLNMNSFNILNPYLNEDMFGKLKKIFSLLNENYLLIGGIILLNNKSRKFKINTFLSKNDDVFKFKYAEIIINGINNYYHINFYKSKKCIETILVTKDLKDNVLKEEELIDYRNQIKHIKNKIERDFFTVSSIKERIIDDISKSEEYISDNLLNYILKYIEKYNLKFSQYKLEIKSKNYLTLILCLKNKRKVLKMTLSFSTYKNEYFCSPSYTIEILNTDNGEYCHSDYNKAYKKFISN
jgi:hypothetical protein